MNCFISKIQQKSILKIISDRPVIADENLPVSMTG
jgi:hypothetical protein